MDHQRGYQATLFISRKQQTMPSSVATRSISSGDFEDIIVPLLARRSCHLPGNTWKEDWWQFMYNNHILLGVCFHHRVHPVEWWERIIALLGSVFFGLAATTFAFLWDRDFEHQQALDEEVFSYNSSYVMTWGTLVLWTGGSLCHSVFDYLLWHVMACSCCHPGGRYSDWKHSNRFKDCGSYFMIPVVLTVTALALWLVLIRASQFSDMQPDDEDVSYTDVAEHWANVDGIKSFGFLLHYIVEITLAWTLFAPIVGTMVFSGVLGCNGRIPVLGGRPRDVRLYQEGKLIHNQSSYIRF